MACNETPQNSKEITMKKFKRTVVYNVQLLYYCVNIDAFFKD